MEVRIYSDFNSYSAHKPKYVFRVECPDTLDFQKTIDVFRSLLGSKCVIVFLIV